MSQEDSRTVVIIAIAVAIIHRRLMLRNFVTSASIHSSKKKVGKQSEFRRIDAGGDRARCTVEAEAGRSWVGAAVGAIEAKGPQTSVSCDDGVVAASRGVTDCPIWV
jgi:hypothetical protein